jgi:Rrf2 family protein
VVWLAANPEKPLTAQQIAEATRVPAGYLAKVLQNLSRAGLLHSQRGLGGGFTLARMPDQLTLWQVVQAVDPINRITECPLSFEAHAELCPLHKKLDEAIAGIEQSFTNTTINQLIDPTKGSSPLCAYKPKA